MIKSLIKNSNQGIQSFRVLQDTFCFRQINDFFLEKTNHVLKKGDVYDGELIYKRNNQYYLFLGYDKNLEYDLFIPIVSEHGEVIIERK
jgi:hypothetical protein